MTDAERRALAEKWDRLPADDEWFVVYRSFQQLMRERATYEEDSVLSLIHRICFMAERPDDMSVFDRLVQRVLENKLLGVTR
jgi:hypothetical protein